MATRIESQFLGRSHRTRLIQRGIPFHLFLVVSLSLSCRLLAQVGSDAEGLPSAEKIVQKTVERVQQLKREGFPDSGFSFQVLSKTEQLDSQGSVREVETQLLEKVPVEGRPFMKVVEKNGRALTDKELEKERKRLEEFRKRLQKGADPKEDEDRVEFNDELVGKYRFTLLGTQDIAGRESYHLEFQPKQGRLPVRRKMDYALNASRGSIWVDKISYSISRLEFELMKKVKLWWGVIGSLQQARGELTFQPLQGGKWIPNRFEFYLKGRILFRALHFRETNEWTGFTLLESD